MLAFSSQFEDGEQLALHLVTTKRSTKPVQGSITEACQAVLRHPIQAVGCLILVSLHS